MSTPINDNSGANFGATATPPYRVAVYIDGLNLFYGLNYPGWRQYHWLDPRRLAERLLRPGQRLAMVKYFTARFQRRAEYPYRHISQDTYLKALATLPDLTIQYGYHLPKTRTCRNCGGSWETFEEKMTDVNIAIALLRDAMQDAFDTAVVISADSDLIGPIDVVLRSCPAKRIVVAFPPKRHSAELERHATAAFKLGRGVIAGSQFPTPVVDANGYPLHKPARWN